MIDIRMHVNSKATIFLIIILLLGTCFIPSSITQTVNQNKLQTEYIDDGQILFSPMYSTKTYLINRNGEVNHSWSSSYTPGVAVYILDDGTIVRTIRLAIYGGAGGGVQKITWDGTKIWDFKYYTDDYLSHHDIELLPNGNVLMIAWESKTREEAINAGRDPNKIQVHEEFMPDHVIEVEPTGPTSGDIVWEWHVWDHLIQDYDPSKDNYGVVEDHPELIDINFGPYIFSQPIADWLHTNSIDYNEEFDQILLSIHNFNEIWIIDHSTTKEEAASHTGGNSGKGGDLLYRWGNPRAYRAGTTSDQKLFNQHDASWIEPGYPGDGNILIFNNGINRSDGRYSSVDEIVPPVDSNGNYFLEPGSSYGPEEPIWIYTADDPTDFYAYYVSGAQRLSNGNTLICDGPAGRFFEVTSEKEEIWEYVNPYPTQAFNHVFKIQYIPPEQSPEEPDLYCEGSLNWKNVKTGITINGNFQVKNIGNTSSLLSWNIESFPNWGNWSFNPNHGENLTPEDGPVNVKVSVVAPDEKMKKFEGYIRVENKENPDDFDVIPVTLKTPKNVFHSVIYQLILKLRQIFPIFEKMFILFSYLGKILI